MSSLPETVSTSPDENAAGLTRSPVDPLRYDHGIFDPDELSGIITQMIPIGSRVLDVGCGTGWLGQIVIERCGADVFGIEPDPDRSRVAEERGLVVRTGYFASEITQGIGLFDIILFTDVLEHVSNPKPMLLLAKEILGPRGAIIVSVPNVAHWSVRVDLIRGRFQYRPSGIMDATHLKWFTADTIKAFIEDSGFAVIKYRATAGIGLRENDYRRPFRWLSTERRNNVLRWTSKKWPMLFGAQHVLKGEPLGPTSNVR